MKQYVKKLLALGLLVSIAAIPAASFAQGEHKTTNEAFGHVGPRHIAKHNKRMRRLHRRHHKKGMRRMHKMHRMDKK